MNPMSLLLAGHVIKTFFKAVYQPHPAWHRTLPYINLDIGNTRLLRITRGTSLICFWTSSTRQCTGMARTWPHFSFSAPFTLVSSVTQQDSRQVRNFFDRTQNLDWRVVEFTKRNGKGVRYVQIVNGRGVVDVARVTCRPSWTVYGAAGGGEVCAK